MVHISHEKDPDSESAANSTVDQAAGMLIKHVCKLIPGTWKNLPATKSRHREH